MAGALSFLCREMVKLDWWVTETTPMKKRPLIESISEFKAILQKAVVRTDELVKLDASFKLPSVIRPQLDFIWEFLNENRVPSPADRARVTIGVLAVRNFDDSDPEYSTWLKALNYAFNHWEQVSRN
jgi:hypothetical protein